MSASASGADSPTSSSSTPTQHDHAPHPHSHEHDYVEANRRHHEKHEHVHAQTGALSEFIADKTAEAVLDAYDFEEEETTLLDYACGRGTVAQKLAAHTKRIVGVDLSQAMVDMFNKTVEDHGITKTEMEAFQKDKISDTSEELNGELFDVVLCASAYHHVPDVTALTLALSRRVKSEGVLIVIDIDSESDFAEMRAKSEHNKRKELEKVVAHKGGFSKKELQDLFEKTDRFSEVTVEVSTSVMLSEMQALKGEGNWSEQVKSSRDLEIRWLIAVGVRK